MVVRLYLVLINCLKKKMRPLHHLSGIIVVDDTEQYAQYKCIYYLL